MRRIVTGLALMALCAGAFVLVAARSEPSGARTYKVVMDNAFGLIEGGEFRVGGVRAGVTKGFEIKPSRSGPPKALVTFEITERGLADLRADTTCKTRPQSLVGEYFLDCQPGTSPKRLPEDGVIPVEQTEGTVPTDLVNNALRRPYRERLKLVVNELGSGLAGRPQDLQDVLRRAHPGLRETSRVLRILGRENRTIERFLADADTVFSQLERRKRDARRFIGEAGETSEVMASRREQLRASLRRLPAFLDELRPASRRVRELADAQVPLLADLERAAPDLTGVLREIEPFARTGRPALRALGRAAEEGDAALREGTTELGELRRVARLGPGTAKPLRQLLQTLDDRRRAIDFDPRAKRGGPPPSDPSYGGGRGGFTGLEAIANYFFWQTFTVNGFDEFGHILRAGLTINECSQLRTEPPRGAGDRELFRKCSSYLGPDQPGIFSPDVAGPAAGGRPPERPSQRARPRAGGRGSARGGRRAPAAGAPAPGRSAPSRPHQVLPPALQDLLDGLGRPLRRGGAGRAGGGAPDQLLDYLLGP